MLIVCSSVSCVERCVVIQNLGQNETVISFEKILFYEENVTLCTTYAWTKPEEGGLPGSFVAVVNLYRHGIPHDQEVGFGIQDVGQAQEALRPIPQQREGRQRVD